MTEKWNVSPEELDIFVAEAEEMLEQITENLLRLEQGQGHDDIRVLQVIFRAAHTIKGGAATIGHQEMTHLAHQMEDVFDRMRAGELAPEQRLINLLLEAVDGLSLMLLDLTQPGSGFMPDLEHLSGSLSGYLQFNRLPQPTTQSQPIDDFPFEEITSTLDEGQSLFNIYVIIQAESRLPAARFLQIYLGLSSLGRVLEADPPLEAIEREEVGREMRLWLSSSSTQEELDEVMRGMEEVERYEIAPFAMDGSFSEELAPAPSVLDNQDSHEATSETELDPLSLQVRRATNIRVDVERLDRIMNLVGELAVERTRLAHLALLLDVETGSSHSAMQLREAVNSLNIIGNDLQHEILRTRMVSLERVFNRFPRAVRDLAQKLEKQVDFTMEGAETELDRLIIEEISDPLLHLLRNALDHGIESPSKRQLMDKNPVASLRLVARYQDGAVFITVEDDGRGIDVFMVKQKAIERNIITAQEAERMTNDETIRLIFRPGFSTAAAVTDVSGRGVGLDIVQNNIERLGGTITLDSQPGQGTRFTLRLPLTLAIIKALLIEVSGQIFALPVGSVHQIERIPRDKIQTLEGLPVFQSQGQYIPLIRLDKALGVVAKSPNGLANGNGQSHAIVAENSELVVDSVNRRNLLMTAIVRFGAWQAGLIVDRFLGEQEVVVKPLGSFIGEIYGIAGAMIQSDGRVALIVDVPSLLQNLTNANRSTARATLRSGF